MKGEFFTGYVVMVFVLISLQVVNHVMKVDKNDKKHYIFH